MCFLEKLIKISFRKHVTVVGYRYRYRKLNKNRMDARMLVLLNMIFFLQFIRNKKMLNVSIGPLFNCRGLACLLSQQQHERCAVLCLVLTAGRNQC